MQNHDEIFELISKVGEGLAEKREKIIEADIAAGQTYMISAVILDHHVNTLKNYRNPSNISKTLKN